MKIKIYISLLLIMFGSLGLKGQTDYYYYNGQKVYLTLDKSQLNITTTENFQKGTISSLKVKEFSLEADKTEKQIQNIARIEFQSTLTDLEFSQAVNTLKGNKEIKNVAPYFKRNNAASIGTSNYFYIKLKNTSDFSVLKEVADQKNVDIVKQVPNMPFWYILSLRKNTIGNSIDLTNYFFETGLFADVDPAFMFNFRGNCTNDTNFGSLWGLYNSANTNIDINACQAWNISQGAGVIVAVLDQGIYKLHNDLASNISTLSYDAQSSTSPSVFISGNIHGTHVAGTIGAIKNNNLQVVGVAPSSQLMSVSHSLSLTPNISAELAGGISWAYQNGAGVINNSWGDQGGAYYNQLHSAVLDNAINNALSLGRGGKGTLVVFAAGNYGSSGAVMDYPANSNANILTVGSITSTGARSSFSGYGTPLDVVAPGSNILSTVPTQGTSSMNGTSMASPHVTGLVALILSINPCLSGQQVRDIIEKTAQKVGAYSYTTTVGRPNGTWNNQMGYGLIDAYAAVLMAQRMYSADLDLYVRDSIGDIGLEPNTLTKIMWRSDDIWVRHLNDNGLVHQNPEYNANGTPNYVYVRVINKSCQASTGNELLKTYWSKAATSLSWPLHWNGTLYQNGVLMGAPIGTLNIPVLQPGQEVILRFPWVVPNPANYNIINPEPWHFCLLARIEAANDPMTFTETTDLNSNVKNNNNIAWKNLSIVDLIPNVVKNIGGVIAVGKPYDKPRPFYLEFTAQNAEKGKAIYDVAEVTIDMDKNLRQAWELGGRKLQFMEERKEDNKIVVKGNYAILNNLYFDTEEMGTLNLTFNFLTDQSTEKSEFTYDVIQKDALTGEIIGGETYVINKYPRTTFVADAGGDKEVNLNQTITISAKDINEPAIYNWYNSDGKLVHQGKDLTVTADVAEKYKLEVIATADGFKDYTEVEVKIKASKLESISPNPTSDKVTVNYKLDGVKSAYLMVIGSNGLGVSNNYILNTNSSQTTLNISQYPKGLYRIVLVCDGKIIDAKNLLKE